MLLSHCDIRNGQMKEQPEPPRDQTSGSGFSSNKSSTYVLQGEEKRGSQCSPPHHCFRLCSANRFPKVLLLTSPLPSSSVSVKHRAIRKSLFLPALSTRFCHCTKRGKIHHNNEEWVTTTEQPTSFFPSISSGTSSHVLSGAM